MRMSQRCVCVCVYVTCRSCVVGRPRDERRGPLPHNGHAEWWWSGGAVVQCYRAGLHATQDCYTAHVMKRTLCIIISNAYYSVLLRATL